MQDNHGRTHWILGTEKFLSFLTPGDKILDVGCGSGEKTKYMIGKGFDVTGIDFSENMIDLAKKAVLLHIPKKQIPLVLENVISVLNSGGYFYASVKEIWPGEKEESILKEDDYGYEYERFFSYFTQDELNKYFQQVGLKIEHENKVTKDKSIWLEIIGKKK